MFIEVYVNEKILQDIVTVSYTHLDVYKRQSVSSAYAISRFYQLKAAPFLHNLMYRYGKPFTSLSRTSDSTTAQPSYRRSRAALSHLLAASMSARRMV